MRPIPDVSTDLMYSRQFPKQDLIEIGEALGTSDIKNITTVTLNPQRALFHACLNGIQTYVRLSQIGETERAVEIAGIADKMYASLLSDYNAQVEKTKPTLEKKSTQASLFCQQFHEAESAKKWDATRFNNTWKQDDYSMRWQKKAIETYGIIRGRIENGEYTPPPDQNAGTLTTYWSLRNLEYKHYRDVARGMVEKYIAEEFTPDQLITMRPMKERVMTLFIGGMCAGKSEMTRHYLERLPAETRTDIILHNADYLKYALLHSAKRDGALPVDHRYTGLEVQAESSNALYEGTRKRGYIARRDFVAPDVALNSIGLGSFEIAEGLANGGRIVAHHLFITPEDAAIEAEKRKDVIGRAPSQADIGWSAGASSKSLLQLTQPQYQQTSITVHLYDRKAGKAPQYYGSIDVAHSRFYVNDLSSLTQMSAVAFPDKSPKEAVREFISQFNKAGYTFVFATKLEPEQVIATLDDQQKLTIADLAAFDRDGAMKEILSPLAASRQTGVNIQLPGAADKKEIIYGR